MKKNLTFLITKDVFYRSYLSDESYQSLASDYTLRHLFLSNVLDPCCITHERLSLKPWNLWIHERLIDLSLMRYRRRSKTFVFRINRRLIPKKASIKTIRNALKYILSYFYLILIYLLSSNKFSYYLVDTVLSFMFVADRKTEKQIITSCTDLFLLPTNGAHPAEWELERLLHKTNKAYISLIDNWDNLSSKTVLRYRANHYCVWGNQSKIHGWEIQDLNFNSMSSIGTPRFETYRGSDSVSLPFNLKNYVLFVGTTVAFDEFKVLQHLNKIINRNNLNTTVVYRPHPWRESNEFPSIDSLEHVVIDEQLKVQYETKSSNASFQPALQYYKPLVLNSKFVIGGLTSMLIEALLLKKKFVGLVHDDTDSKINPKNMLRDYTHFREIPNLKNVTLVTDFNELEATFLQLYSAHSSYEDDPFLQYFITFDDESYWEKLLKVIENHA